MRCEEGAPPSLRAYAMTAGTSLRPPKHLLPEIFSIHGTAVAGAAVQALVQMLSKVRFQGIPHETMSPSCAERGTRTNMGTVLVIDDERMIRWSIEQTLRQAGYEVRAAGTAAEGLALFRDLHPQVVFLDVRLPDADGLTVLRQMKDEGGDSAAVVVMTACGENRTAAEARRLGACAYLPKPFDFEGLATLVHRAMEAQKPEGARDNR
jgi:CheY-like chemotaxis protein